MRPHAGEDGRSARLRELMAGSGLWRAGAARNLQDPLSIRCVPQTHGALYDALSVARGTMEIELNSASDNPLVVVDEDAIVSVGNFDVVALAMAFDFVRLGFAHAAQVANERVQKLLWDHFSGLPTGLTPHDGPTGGLRPLGRSFAALAAETRFLANPVSLDYRGQLAEGIEDHASMAPLAVSTTSQLVSLMHRLVALELIIAAQAVDLRGDRRASAKARGVAYEFVREHAPTLTDETEWNVDIDGLARSSATGELARRVAAASAAARPVRARGAGDLMPAGAIERAVDLLAQLGDEAPRRDGRRARERRRGADEHRLPPARRARAPRPRPARGGGTVSLGTRVVALGRAAEASLRRAAGRPGGAGDGATRRASTGETAILTAPCGLEAIVLHVVETEQAGAPLLRGLPPRADAPRRLREGARRLPRAR